MSRKIKRFGIFLLFSLPILYFVFTLLFFSPFEDPFGRIEYVVPRQVDFYLSKAGLADDFDAFPVPRFYKQLEVDHRWRSFMRTELYNELEQQLALGDVVEQIQANLIDLPIEPLKDLVGQELAVAGNLKDGGEMPFSYLVFFKGSWKAKLGYELLSWDWVRGMAGDPLVTDSQVLSNPGGYLTFQLGDGRIFYLSRERDLVLFGDDEKLMQEVCQLIRADRASMDLSIGGSQSYRSTIAATERLDRSYLDFHLNVENLLERETFDEEWKANDMDFAVMTAMEVFDPVFFKSATGSVRLGSYLDLKTKLDFYTERVNRAETGFFGLESISLKEKMRFLSSMLPPDVFLAGCLRLDLDPLLRIMEGNLDGEVRKLITDLIREGRRWNRDWKVVETYRFIEKLAATFEDVAYFALRPRSLDKPMVPGVQPVPIISLVLQIRDMASFSNMEKTVREMQGNNRQTFEMWKLNKKIHGCTIKGINTPGADDIEQIAYTVLEDRYLILSTSSSLIQDMLIAKYSSGHSLKDSDAYKPATEFFDGHGNLGLYINTAGLKQALSNYAVYWAEVITFPDFAAARAAEREKVLRREFPQHIGKAKLPEADEAKVEKWVDAAMVRLDQKREDEDIPRLINEFRRQLAWIDLLDSLSFSLNVNVNDLDLGLRLSSLFSKK